jgi:hypothetical protein
MATSGTNLSSRNLHERARRPSRSIWSIATTDVDYKVRQRQAIRRTYQSMYTKNDPADNPYRICSLDDLQLDDRKLMYFSRIEK